MTYTLITGASAGLGVEFAKIAAREQRSIILTARRADRLHALVPDLKEIGADDVQVIVADLSDKSDVERLWSEATALGQIDILINNAGLGYNGRFDAADGWAREVASIDVNVLALTTLMKLAVPHMQANGDGRILNVASLAGFVPGPNMAVYHATKAYVLSLSEAVAEELSGSNVSVTALCPGATETEFFQVAEMEDITLVKSGATQSAREVALDGWAATKSRTRVIVPGFLNKVTALLPRILPRTLVAKTTKIAMARDDESPLRKAQEMATKAGQKAKATASQAYEKANNLREQATDPDSELSQRIKERSGQFRTRAKILGDRAASAATVARHRFDSGLSTAQGGTTKAPSFSSGSSPMSQTDQMRSGKGFVAALDQSGGSTPKALRLYGVEESEYGSEVEMFDMIHAMRSRIVASPAFSGDKVIAAILFEMTMDRDFGGKPSASYLWEDKGVVPFLKCDKGLEAEANGVQLMKDMGDLDGLLSRAREKGVFGTKMRSVINAANAEGIAANVAQQVEIGKRILGHGLVPILEPEVTISISDKAEAEAILRDELIAQLDRLDTEVMLKLSLPSEANFYRPLIDHPKVLRVVALSGGYSREDANAKLTQNNGMIASFSRALTEGLSAGQSDSEFDATLAATINSIYEASIT